jgi:V/A-type H+-transporting ATPase subunit K
MENLGLAFAMIGAGLAIGLAGMGAVIGTAKTASSGAGLISENPSFFGKVLILSTIPETHAIFGFLVTILILQKAGVLGGESAEMTLQKGLALFSVGIPIAITGLAAGISQGLILSNGMRILAKDESQFGKVIILAALAETVVIFGLLVSILILTGIK